MRKHIFRIEVIERLKCVVEVEAESLSDAIEKVAVDYDNAKIVLGPNDFDGYEIREE